ncbi:MAG TPA: stimulus-sensing domain-containing protein [Alphaproteobacteria bacterium]|nr:stimulus-sensing domain-containing protein [Alphaproteobacteria bacterium]
MRGTGRRFSLLTVRILALNVLALGTLVAGFLFLGDYRQNLIDAKITSLGTQASIFAGALGESAVETNTQGNQTLIADPAKAIVRRMVEATRTRARLFDTQGSLITDSRTLLAPSGFVLVEELPPPGRQGWFNRNLTSISNWLTGLFRKEQRLPKYNERVDQVAGDYREVVRALGGEPGSSVREGLRGQLVLTYAVPVQRYKKVVAVVMLSATDAAIERDVADVRVGLLKIFGVVLAITVLLSFYLARTIARPIRRLAIAADRVRRGHGRFIEIPDFSRRRDEIGDLSAVLQRMTKELWERIEAIERFAADVSHEIKNPLTSLRSAVETAARIKDPDRQRKLMDIVLEDVERLDRLITDISRASRLDAELQRAEMDAVDMRHMLTTLAEVEGASTQKDAPKIVLDLPNESALTVLGVEDRLVQVLRNVIANAKTFSPPRGIIRVSAAAEGKFVTITVDDQGPGLPIGKLEAIFDRFYTERPAGEKFGTHSGLGLSISKQIMEAHDGQIFAENMVGPDGETLGARFVVRVPAL